MDDQTRPSTFLPPPGGTPVALTRVPTGIAGLDHLLGGGVPEGRTTLVAGPTGSGKTLLALEFLYRGARQGAPGIWIGFGERAHILRRNALTLGWDLAALEREGRLGLLDGPRDPRAAFEHGPLIELIEGQAIALGAHRMVVDGADGLLRLLNSPQRERHELYLLEEWLAARAMTALVTARTGAGASPGARYEGLEAMANTVLHLEERTGDGVADRRLRVIRYRGAESDGRPHPCLITPEGFALFPLPDALPELPPGPVRSSGQGELDALLGGGIPQGAAVVLGGPSGSGKSLLAGGFAHAACLRGEKVLYLAFDRPAPALLATLSGAGLDLEVQRGAGRLALLCAPAELPDGVERHLFMALRAIDAHRPDHLIVDGVAALERLGADAVRHYWLRLLHACRASRRTLLVTHEFMDEGPCDTPERLPLAAQADIALWLRLRATPAGLGRALLVVKSARPAPLPQWREVRVSPAGIALPPLPA